jgi:hypothetical protein
MPIASVDDLIAALGLNHLLGPEHLHEVDRDLRHLYPDADTLADELVRRGWLTAYTADTLLGRVRPPSRVEPASPFSDGPPNFDGIRGPAFRRRIAGRLGKFVLVSLLIGLGLYLLLAVPPGWAAFWGFTLYRVAWRPSDLADRTCGGCGCAFVTLAALTAFVLNCLVGQPLEEAFGRGGLFAAAILGLYYVPLAVAATRENNRLQRRRREIPALSPEEAKSQVERLMTNPRLCRTVRAFDARELPGEELGPLLGELFGRFARVEFLWDSGHVPSELQFDRGTLRPSDYLIGYTRLNHCDWLSRETAVKPGEDTVYVIDARDFQGYDLGRRKREVPEVMETYPTVYHFILSRLVYSGHPLAVQVPT